MQNKHKSNENDAVYFVKITLISLLTQKKTDEKNVLFQSGVLKQTSALSDGSGQTTQERR